MYNDQLSFSISFGISGSRDVCGTSLVHSIQHFYCIRIIKHFFRIFRQFFLHFESLHFLLLHLFAISFLRSRMPNISLLSEWHSAFFLHLGFPELFFLFLVTKFFFSLHSRLINTFLELRITLFLCSGSPQNFPCITYSYTKRSTLFKALGITHRFFHGL